MFATRGDAQAWHAMVVPYTDQRFGTPHTIATTMTSMTPAMMNRSML